VDETELSKPPAAILDDVDLEAERFFAQGEAVTSEADSLSPSVAGYDEWESPLPPPPLTPEQLARRERFRRLVSIGLASGVAILVSGIGAARLASSARARVVAPPSASVALMASPPASTEAVPAANVTPEAPPTPSATVSASAAAPAKDDQAPRMLTKARALLRAGRAREGVAVARSAIEADANLAEAYVLLAAGLEDLGLWSEAQRTFAICAERTRSPECRYFAKTPR